MSAENHLAPRLDPLQRQAVVWVQRLHSGQATSEDARAVEAWCAQSPAHAAAFSEASRTWSNIPAAGNLLRRCGGDSLVSLDQFADQRRPIDRRALLGGGLATAAAAAYATVYPPLDLWPSLSELRADYRTATGEQRQIKLGDAVSVQLNTQSSIALRASDATTDRIQLVAGEASFSASAQTQRSLMVLAAEGKTIGSRARFDIRHIKGSGTPSVCVTCLDGQVRIELGRAATTLNSGHQLRYDAIGLGQAVAIDPEIASSWQRGIVVFRATPLAEVVEEINRYRPGRIVLINRKLGLKSVSGRFRTDQMDGILNRLAHAFGAKIRMLPGGIVLLT